MSTRQQQAEDTTPPTPASIAPNSVAGRGDQEDCWGLGNTIATHQHTEAWALSVSKTLAIRGPRPVRYSTVSPTAAAEAPLPHHQTWKHSHPAYTTYGPRPLNQQSQWLTKLCCPSSQPVWTTGRWAHQQRERESAALQRMRANSMVTRALLIVPVKLGPDIPARSLPKKGGADLSLTRAVNCTCLPKTRSRDKNPPAGQHISRHNTRTEPTACTHPTQPDNTETRAGWQDGSKHTAALLLMLAELAGGGSAGHVW